jgi:hypothetical protein
MPSEISVICLGSTSGAPFQRAYLSVNVPSRVTAGMVSAGMNNLFPQRAALASRSARVVPSAGAPPSFPIAMTRTMVMTSNPFSKLGSSDPKRNVTP